MKEETKKIVQWIKEALNNYITASFDTFANTPAKNKFQRENCNNAIAFLDSLPEIESHLCRGGYIQDKNGTPCCHGDAIKYNSEVYGEQICTLEWDNVKARFFAVYKAGQLQDGSVFKLEQQLEFTTDEIEKYESTL